MTSGDAEQGAERGVPGTTAVEAEDELVEIGLQMLAAQAVVDTQRPDLEVREDAVHPGQDDVGGHLTNDVGIVFDAGSAGIGGPSVGLGGGAWCEVAGDEGVQAVGRVVGHLVQADAAWTGPTVLHLDGTDDQHLALVAAATTAGHGIVLTAAGNFGLVDFNQTGQRGPAGRDHAMAQLATEQPSTPVRSQPSWRCNCRAEMPLEWVAIR